MFKARRLVVFLVAAALPTSAVADDWQYYAHDTAHTSSSTALVDPLSLSLAWTAPFKYSTPLIDGNAVYATNNGQGTGNPTTYSSFNLINGAINWSYTVNFPFPSEASIGGGYVAFVAGSSSSTQSLYLLDELTGALRYTVPLPNMPLSSQMPVIVRNPVSGALMAFVSGFSRLAAVSLGPSSGSVLWTRNAVSAGANPTVAGNSILMAGPGAFGAFDQSTGTENRFHAGDVSSSGGTTVTYDATRNQLYVQETYDIAHGLELSAYHYTDNAHISLLWQRSGPGISGSCSVAIGPGGLLYSAGPGAAWELDPVTGQILRTIPGSFFGTPVVSDGVLWLFAGTGNSVLAYDLLTLHLLRSFPGGGTGGLYANACVVSDGHLLVDYGTIYNTNSLGFDVYAGPVPEPSVIALLAIVGVALFAHRKIKHPSFARPAWFDCCFLSRKSAVSVHGYDCCFGGTCFRTSRTCRSMSLH